MKRYVRPSSPWRTSSMLTIWAPMDTSRAEMGSSQITRSGAAGSAQALIVSLCGFDRSKNFSIDGFT